jgi:hypothetical protein
MNGENKPDAVQWRALAIGVTGLILCALVALFSPAPVFRSYLVAYNFWLGIALGCLAIVMLYHLTGGRWGLILRRLLESGSRTLPVLAVLFLPIIFGLFLPLVFGPGHLYIWTDPHEVAGDNLLQRKSHYLNIPGFIIRAVVYFAVWIVIAFLLNWWSREQDRTGDPDLSRRMRILSGPGLVLYGLAVTFASVDWLMSLQPLWFSTIFPVVFAMGQVLAGLAFVIAVMALLMSQPPLSETVSAANLQDIGNLLLAFVMFWSYVAFAQFLLIWSGNLPEEIQWYLPRFQGGWQWLGVSLVLCQFALPFLLLLSRDIKRNPRALAAVAVFVLVMRFVDLVWQILPTPRTLRPQPDEPGDLLAHWLDIVTAIVAVLGVGGIWIAVFLWQLKKMPLLPLHDPEGEPGYAGVRAPATGVSHE